MSDAPKVPPRSARRCALEAWRRHTAREAGIPEYAILGNAVLDALAVATAPTLAGLGPRARAKYGEELLRIVAAHGPDHYFPPVDRRQAELLERIEAGARIFRPGADVARVEFQGLVEELRGLRERGLIDMPELSLTAASEAGASEAGASEAGVSNAGTDPYPCAGPCYLTDAGRAELLEFRQGGRR